MTKEQSLKLLKTLTEAFGVSGFEAPVRTVVGDLLAPLSTGMQTDNMGSLIASKTGFEECPKLLLAAHLDEVGFMVTRITDGGFIKFQQLGGWWSQVLPDQRVEIRTANGSVAGVIGAKPPHILSKEEAGKTVKLRSMYVDVGATCREEAEKAGVRVGDPIVPCSRFEVCKNGKSFMGKALDDRAGCAMIVEVFRELDGRSFPGNLYGVMTVQEEVGLRGAATSVTVVKPDVAVVLDVTVATDTPNVGEDEATTRTGLGKGPVVGFYDATMIPNIALRDLVASMDGEAGIPFQAEVMPGGGTDAGKIHIYRQGVPSIVVGIPVRYIHSHVGIAHLDDYANGVELVLALVNKLDRDTVDSLKA
jgi:endoglucanase